MEKLTKACDEIMLVELKEKADLLASEVNYEIGLSEGSLSGSSDMFLIYGINNAKDVIINDIELQTSLMDVSLKDYDIKEMIPVLDNHKHRVHNANPSVNVFLRYAEGVDIMYSLFKELLDNTFRGGD